MSPNTKKPWPLIGHRYKLIKGPLAGTIAKLIDLKENSKENIFVIQVETGFNKGKTMEVTSNLVERGLQDGSIQEVFD
jgi:hypothetical protein